MRYEPPPQPANDLAAPGVAAALLLGAGRWGCGHSTAAVSAAKAVQPPLAHPLADAPGDDAAAAEAMQPVVLQSLSLWVAAADGQCAAPLNEHAHLLGAGRRDCTICKSMCLHKVEAAVTRLIIFV